MKVVKARDVAVDIVREPGAKNLTIRRLIDLPDGADRFLMSMFELGKGGASPPHYHDWEHEMYVLDGNLHLELPSDGKRIPLKQGDVVFIPRGEAHGLVTAPDETARILLVAPAERPPTQNVFLSEDPYVYDSPSAE